MHAIAWLLTTVVVMVATAPLSQITIAGAAARAPQVSTEAVSDCPISMPNDRFPPGLANNNGNLGNDALWTNLSMWSSTPGIVDVPDDDRIDADGTINGMKWAWYRFVDGTLTIEGRRVDAPDDPLMAEIPSGYGETGFQVSGLTFPSAGCWEITGSVADVELTFVVLVVLPPNGDQTEKSCPITKPNDAAPDHWHDDPGFYGNDALGTSLTMWSDKPGVVEVPNDGHIAPDGTVLEMKWAWHRFEKGELEITGCRLDAPDDLLIAWIPDGCGDLGFQVSELTFPSAGCWEITGTLNDSRLTFVVLVVLPSDWKRDATPLAAISRFHGFERTSFRRY